MMSKEVLLCVNEQKSNNYDGRSGGLQTVDSRDDVYVSSDHVDGQNSLSREFIDNKEDAEVTSPGKLAVKQNDQVSADARKIAELRQAILELRVYTCKLKGTNRHLQRQNELVKEENTSLANKVCILEKNETKLRAENEQLRKELVLKTAEKADTTMSTLSSLDDDVFEFDENSHADNLVPLSVTIDPKLLYATNNEPGTINDPNPELEPAMKSRDTLYDIDELQITTTNDDEDNASNLRMELGQSREQCEELQRDLKKIAEDYWKQREEMKRYQLRNNELQDENDKLQRLKWIEDEVDTLWAHVKETDKANSERLDQLESMFAEKEELKAALVQKTNEVEQLKEQLRNAPCPDWVHAKMDEIQNDVKIMRNSAQVPSF